MAIPAPGDWAKADIILGTDYVRACGECVYGWFRGNECLYIGNTGNGFGRIFSHNRIGKTEPVLPTDEIKVLWIDTSGNFYAGLNEEARLIEHHKPKYNAIIGKDNLGRVATKVNCIMCGKEFQQARWWQKTCQRGCKGSSAGSATSDNNQPAETTKT